LVEAIEAALPPAVYVAGSPYRGIGLPDCIHQAQMTADALLHTFGRPHQPGKVS
jgi:oxygen-dependent protoporphyrinogen oxidase